MNSESTSIQHTHNSLPSPIQLQSVPMELQKPTVLLKMKTPEQTARGENSKPWQSLYPSIKIQLNVELMFARKHGYRNVIKTATVLHIGKNINAGVKWWYHIPQCSSGQSLGRTWLSSQNLWISSSHWTTLALHVRICLWQTYCLGTAHPPGTLLMMTNKANFSQNWQQNAGFQGRNCSHKRCTYAKSSLSIVPQKPPLLGMRSLESVSILLDSCTFCYSLLI